MMAELNNKMYVGYGEKLDIFFALESCGKKGLLICKVFYKELKCKDFVKKYNTVRRESLSSDLKLQ